MAPQVRIGTSGWNYPHWADGIFYPPELKPPGWLSFYSRHFNSVEVNNTFYRLPERAVFQKWRSETPGNFLFAVKANRFITHVKRLADPEASVSRFLENAAGLQEKLGPLLFQLPPTSKRNLERLEGLLACLHRQKIVPGVRAALEVRHASWLEPGCFSLLKKYNAALVLADWPGLNIRAPVCADFVFVRRHSPEPEYGLGYPDAHLRRDARLIRGWVSEGRSVYIYFNNDAGGFAARNARRLKQLLAGKLDEESEE